MSTRELLLQSVKFAAVGIVNTAIGLACIYATMYFFGASPVAANAVGYALGFLVSFMLNRTWTFNSNSPISRVVLKYLLVAVLAYLLNLGFALGAIYLFGVNPYLAQLAGVLAYSIVLFAGSRWYVFSSPYVACTD